MTLALARREAGLHRRQVAALADNGRASERRVDLVGTRLEHQQRQTRQPAAEQRPVATRQAVGHDRITQPAHRPHLAAALTGDRHLRGRRHAGQRRHLGMSTVISPVPMP